MTACTISIKEAQNTLHQFSEFSHSSIYTNRDRHTNCDWEMKSSLPHQPHRLERKKLTFNQKVLQQLSLILIDKVS